MFQSTALGVLCVLCGWFWFDIQYVTAAPQDVVPVDGAMFRGELVSVDDDGRATFRVTDGKDRVGRDRTLRLDEIVRYGNPAPPRRQTIIALADGGQIITAADWSGSATVKLAGDDFVIVSDLWDEVRLPRGLVSVIVFAPQRRIDDRERLLQKARSEVTQKDTADVVLLANGDRLSGKVTGLDKGSLAIETRSGVVKAPLPRVEAISFGGAGAKTREETAPAVSRKESGQFAIGLRDGSLVYANSIRADDKTADIELTNGVTLKGAKADDVTAIQSLGGAAGYLSDLPGADYRGVPYLSVKWPFARDRNVLGEPIVVREKRYLKGIGMHSAARLTYRLDGDYRRFDASIAIDDSAKGRGSVVFAVYALRDGKWGEAFKSSIVRGADDVLPVSVDLSGAKGITLTVDFADRGDELDHAVWLDARLVR